VTADWGPFGLSGQAAIVTGATRGIGKGLARALAQAGADVVVGARRLPDGEAVARELRDLGGRAVVVVADVTDEASADVLVEGCVDAFGRLDIVVNNAGVFPLALVGEIRPDEVSRVLDVNFAAPLRLTQAAAEHMKAAGRPGVIVNVGSTDALRPSLEGFTVYGASKAALRQMTRAMALELGRHGIRVVSVSPGVIFDEEDGIDESILTEFTRRVPLGRPGRVEDVGSVVVFLASSAAQFITGTDLLVEGGNLLT
jgi:2-deoxy-D-gluconate 3-dehydrogenase